MDSIVSVAQKIIPLKNQNIRKISSVGCDILSGSFGCDGLSKSKNYPIDINKTSLKYIQLVVIISLIILKISLYIKELE